MQSELHTFRVQNRNAREIVTIKCGMKYYELIVGIKWTECDKEEVTIN